jgi:glycine cleavage system regulatory protein/spore maturation protein SpmB
MFVVDDLVGWLIGRLADAGYQKLSTRLRGSDQARALKEAVTAAVEATVGEIGPSDGEKAERVAGQINKAFRRREPIPLPPGQPTLLEALQAGIAGQLSARDDAGHATAGLLGVPVSEVAAKLTGHLIRQIQIRGSRPGPLTPLAGQLNDDLTHLHVRRLGVQGQRIEGMLAQVLDLLGDGPAPPGGPVGPAGQPLAEVGDPFALEVHRPVDPDVPQPDLPVLPRYVSREHDAALAEVVTAAAAGTSGIAVLVGGSSTGKTRACWEALTLLRDQPKPWRLWHPIDPQGALAGLAGVEPRTVAWLNETQRYLGPVGGAGEQVAAGLRELLLERDRGPVLVLATLWPDYWAELTVRPPRGADPHAQARELLTGHDIPVPATFADEQLRQLEEAGDPRLVQAAAGSRDGQVIQYLAGAPELLDRYHNAPPAARALIDAAMDAGRLGMRAALPRAFLETAAPGYLTDADWDLLPGDWLEQALDYTAQPCKGVRGPLAPIRPRPAPGAPATPGDGPACQLADYLDQHGRRTRREEIPPASFWAAAASYADPADLNGLGRAAERRGLSRDAARLYKQASAHGDPRAGARLVRLLQTVHPGDQRPADWAAAHASLDNPDAVASLLDTLREAGATGPVTALADRAAAHASLDSPDAVASLLDTLREAGATGPVTVLADRAAAHASLDDPHGVARLLDTLRGAGATGQVAALLDRDPAACASLDSPYAVARLLRVLHEAGATGQVTALADRAAAHASLDDPLAVATLLVSLYRAGATGQVTVLLDRDPAACASLDEPHGVARLLDTLREAGATGQVTALADRAAADASLDSPYRVVTLLDTLREAGATGQVTVLADRAAACASLDDPSAVASLLDTLRGAGATGQVTVLADRAAACASLDSPYAVVRLLRVLHEAGATGQVTVLADRADASYASLDDPDALAQLLSVLREAGETGEVTVLADRAAAHAGLDSPSAVARLLRELREAGATGQVAALLDRDPAAHARLDDPLGVTGLLRELREAGATGQVAALLDRDPAAHARLDNPDRMAGLLRVLREAGARAQATELIERLPAAGMFRDFCKLEGREEQFRFGREDNGRPAGRWTWTDVS